MLPTNSNTTVSAKSRCTPVSSTCVVWNGPDIPCINLCQGDSIESVVHQLATLLCESTAGVIDVTTLDFKCLVENEQSPATLLDTLQALIDKVCAVEDCCEGGGETTAPEPIALPSCLYYTENGDTITQLLPAAYSRYLADKICVILTTIASVQSAINSLNVRVTTLENIVENLGGDPEPITVTTQCASGVNPGLVLNITEAFSNFEAKFCQLHSLLGTLSELTAAINQQCPDLADAAQLSDPLQTMSDIPGWILSPVTVADTLNNLWLTLCDMRTAIASQGQVDPPCVLVPVSNVELTNLTTTGCTVSWTLPVTTGAETPSGYTVTVTEWNGTTTVGSPIVTTSVNHPASSVVFGTLGEQDKFYKVEVVAAYSCGNAVSVSVIGQVRLSVLQYYIRVTDLPTATSVTVNCDGVDHPAVERMTTIQLINPANNQVITNNGAPVTAILRYNVTHDCAVSPTEDVAVTISSGQSQATYTYLGEQKKQCGQDPCTTEYKAFGCGVSIDIATIGFEPAVPTC